MTEGRSQSDRLTQATEGRPEELPPVTPPSAGFIVQLFLIPALIVMAVVAVWALFGKLADSGNDWTPLVADLGSGNEHRQWRAAQELAQMIRNEQLRPPQDREPLASNPLVADALTALLRDSLKSTTSAPEEILQQEFLVRALGALDADEKTLPVLADAMNESRDIEVRKSSLMAVASIAGRRFDKAVGYNADKGDETITTARNPLKEPTVSDAALLEELRRATQDPQVVIRHLAAYATANISGPSAIEQLKVMLLDGDRQTRANAVMGLARNGEPAAVAALMGLLKDAQKPFDSDSMQGKSAQELMAAEQAYKTEQPVLARNGLRAVGHLWGHMSPSEKQETCELVEALASSKGFAPDVLLQARGLLNQIGNDK